MLGIDVFPLDTALVIPAATAAFAAASLFFTSRSIIYPPHHASSMKALGTLLVITLALAANTPLLYGLAVFIVATLVTELSFLEKIAALIWNRGKFWDWMIAKESVPEAEARIAEQARSEAEATIPVLDANDKLHPCESATADAHLDGTNAPPKDAVGDRLANPVEDDTVADSTKGPATAWTRSTTTRVNAFVSDTIHFERDVQQALRDTRRPFFGTVKSNLRISSSSASSSVEVDALVETASIDYVVEIKFAKTSQLLLRGSRHVRRAADAYRAYLRERGRTKDVLPVLIVPADVDAPSIVDSLVPVLKFDLAANKFTNVNDFLLAAGDLHRV